MVRYQLSTGRTVLLTMDQLLDMTDEKIQELIANNAGIEIEDVFSDFNGKETHLDLPDVELEDIPEEIKKQIEEDFETDK